MDCAGTGASSVFIIFANEGRLPAMAPEEPGLLDASMPSVRGIPVASDPALARLLGLAGETVLVWSMKKDEAPVFLSLVSSGDRAAAPMFAMDAGRCSELRRCDMTCVVSASCIDQAAWRFIYLKHHKILLQMALFVPNQSSLLGLSVYHS
jgi:hypothetical protein